MPRRIVRVEGWLCRLPLRWPVRLGTIVYPSRDYAVIRVTCDDGLVGRAVGYTRGTALLESLRTLCDRASTLDAAHPTGLQTALRAAYLPGWAQFIRAASLLDIALWDVVAQAAGQPLHRMMGAERDDVPLMAVAGYFADQRSDDELIAEAVGFAEAGMAGVKLILPGRDAEHDEQLTGRIAAKLPAETFLAVDFHAPWQDIDSAARHCEPLARLGLRFIEDPFPATEWRALGELARRLDVPLAAGEDMPSAAGFRDLLESVRFLRLDATSSGGISTMLKVAGLVREHGATAVPHVFPYVHAPLCAALDVVSNAEYIPAPVGSDPIDRLLAEPAPCADGRWVLSDRPGLDLPLDWDAVARASVNSFTYEAEAGER